MSLMRYDGNTTLEKGRTSTMQKTLTSNRDGPRSTIYGIMREEMNKDKDVIMDKSQRVFPFKSGATYKGEWKSDMKHGFGTEDASAFTYKGEWERDKRHGRGTLWMKKGKTSVYQYMGDWVDGEKHGYGTYYYDNKDQYEGNWKHNKRHGSGKHTYVNGDYYVGSWENDLQNGLGSMHYSNGNLFEGMWMNGKKEGKGRFYYASTHKIYEGEWVDDQPCCGEYRDPKKDEENRFEESTIRHEVIPLPKLQLKDTNNVLKMSITEIRSENATRRGLVKNSIDKKKIEKALSIFESIDKHSNGVISIHMTDKIFEALGLQMTRDTVRELSRQLELENDEVVSFPVIVDIAVCILQPRLEFD